MVLCWLALTLSAVIILRLASVSLPAELGGFASFPVEEHESFFVECSQVLLRESTFQWVWRYNNRTRTPADLLRSLVRLFE